MKSAAFVIAAMAGISAPFQAVMATKGKAQSIPKITAPAPSFSDARLKAFATASTKVMEIRQKYWPRTQESKNDDEARKILKTAQKEMLDAIKAHGLTIEQYNEIVAATQNDRSLIERIEKIEMRMKKN